MSFPNIPPVNACVNITTENSANLLLASIAFEELGLAHIINAEAEKIQYVLGTLEASQDTCSPKCPPPPEPPTTDELLEINRSVNETLKNVIRKEMLLQLKLEDTLTLLKPPVPCPHPHP